MLGLYCALNDFSLEQVTCLDVSRMTRVEQRIQLCSLVEPAAVCLLYLIYICLLGSTSKWSKAVLPE